MAFTKMKPMCDFKERHSLNLGHGYKNDHTCATFVEFIAREQQQQLITALSHCKYFSLQVDVSADAGNLDNELFLVLHLDPIATDGKVLVHDSFFTVRQLSSETAQILYDCMKQATCMRHVGVDDWVTDSLANSLIG